MTSKKLFFNLMKEDAKQRLWAVALGFLAFFFLLPVRSALFFASYEFLEERNYVQMTSRLKEWLGFGNGWMAALMIALSLILGVTGFSYLHSRQRVDFYHGIPVKREKLFWANYCNGILFTGILYAVNLILAVIVASVNGIHAGAIINTALSGFLLFVLHFCLLYSVTVLSMVLTGNVVVGILGTFVLHFIFPCVLAVIQTCFFEFFHTSYQYKAIFANKLADKCSAFILFLSNMRYLTKEVSAGIQAARIFAVLTATAVITLLSLFLYKKRGSEAAGRAMAFAASQAVIRIPIVALSSLFGSLFFWSIRSNLGWAVFGLLCGMLLSHCIIEIIYHFDFRKLFSHWKQMAACGVAAAVIFGCFRYDIFGYDQYIPKESSIESTAIAIYDFNYWVSYGKAVPKSGGGYSWEYEDENGYLFSNMKLTDSSVVLALVKKAVERNQNLSYASDSWEEEERRQFCMFSVRYHLKNGRKVYRTYSLPAEEMRTELGELYSNPDFLKAVYPVLTQTPEETAWVRVRRGERTATVSRDRNGTDKAMTEKLLLAYQQDFAALNAETMEKENPVAAIQFMTQVQAQAEKEREQLQSSWKYNDVISRGFYPVYPSFHNTLELLKECQVDVDSWNILDEVKKITFDADQFREYVYEADEQSLTITDAGEIRQIMEKAAIEEYSNMNPFYDQGEEQAVFSAFIEKEGNRQEIFCTIAVEKLPEPVRKQIEQMKDQE